MSSQGDFPSMLYGSSEVIGVASLVVAGAISLFAVLPTLAVMRPQCLTLRNTNIVPFFISLLVANVLQAVGTVMNGNFVVIRTLTAYFYALVHPVESYKGDRSEGSILWTVGYWCWITNNYPKEQTFLEYFFEFVSAFLSFILYTSSLLRVRGNIIKRSGKWCLRFVPRGERWQLAVARDVVDSSMMRVAARMIWYPIAYTILLLPVTLARFIEFGGHEVPFWATIFSDFVFNLQGVVNVVLFVSTRRFIPDTEALPIFVPRRIVSFSSPEAFGLTPFILPMIERPARPTSILHISRTNLHRTTSMSTISSVDSQTPMINHSLAGAAFVGFHWLSWNQPLTRRDVSLCDERICIHKDSGMTR
ncbi:hypothetical protein A0H81_02414 [Grifola frondosa]|uniref:G-protein coupled receptors family 1 profile domain-containing protein n=1 Tax=Grifola frondosa TaxID=5627 RepID=A0A1C7MML4_GRIFR|nr:hypothetical protein A0H81_02414 [Grifola frondosa]